MKKFNSIIKDIKNNKILPVYFLHGEESFYINRLSNYIENNILTELEKVFNQTIVYSHEINMKDLILLCKEFPINANKKVIIVKEAQSYKDSSWKYFESYIQNIQLTTVLVIQYKNKKLDKRKKIYKILNTKNWIFEFNKLYNYQILNWILDECSNLNLKIEEKSASILADFLGNDISKIYNELKKLAIIVSDNRNITLESIKNNILLEKEYTDFDLISALARRDIFKSFEIANFISKNDKNFTLVKIIPKIFSFFVQLMLIFSLNDKSEKSINQLFNINSFVRKQYLNAIKKYNINEVIQILSFLYEYDLKSKGIKSTNNIYPKELIKELIYKILNFKS